MLLKKGKRVALVEDRSAVYLLFLVVMGQEICAMLDDHQKEEETIVVEVEVDALF